jgi:lysine 6-dehydrogenase
VKKVIVLGATGTIGQVIVKDLIESGVEVLAADMDAQKLEQLKQWTGNKITTAVLNIKDEEKTQEVLRQGQVCVNATNYIFNIDVMKAAAAAGISVIDLGGLYNRTIEQLKLHDEMKEAGILAITGMGSDPGTSNILSHYGVSQLDTAEEIHIRYGSTTSGATFTFAIDTIIDEAIQNALAVKDGKLVEIPPLADEEDTVFHEDIGTQRTYSIIHSEFATLPMSFPEVKQITYKDTWDPATIDKIRVLRELGLLDEESVQVAGKEVIPRRQTVSLMQTVLAAKEEPVWGKDVLLVEVKGIKNGNQSSIKLQLRTDPHEEWGVSATQYATAIPASIVAQMILNGEVTAKGVKPPEQCIDSEKFLSYLKKKDIKLFITQDETVTV